MQHRTGLVRIDGKNAGILAESEHGFEFSYLQEWLTAAHPTPVSLTMPLGPEPYITKQLHPFF
jgi:serine/threonine-protein kinase HipA